MKRYQKNSNYQALSEEAKLIFDYLALPLLLIPGFQLSNDNLNVLFGLNDPHMNRIKKVITEFKDNNILDIQTETIQRGLNDFRNKRTIQLKDMPRYATLTDKLEWFYKNYIEEVK